MSKKEFNVITTLREALPRSKRRRAASQTGSSGTTINVVSSAGDSGDGHIHDNKAVLDSLSMDDDGYVYLRHRAEGAESSVTEKVKAGYADEAGHAVNADAATEAAHALKADAATEAGHSLKADEATEAAHAVKADYASEAGHALKADDAEKWNGKRMDELIDQPVRSGDEVEFAKVTTKRVVADMETDGTVVSSETFDGASSLTGTGYGIMKEGNDYRMAIDYLTVRKGMKVAELVIQEYKSVGGVLVVSACNGEIESLHKWSNGEGYDVYIKDFDKNPQFVAGDYVRCARWDSETGAYVGYWVKVVAIATNSAGVKCLNLMSSGFPEGTEPQVGDKLVQFGNATDTTRQGLILISVEDGKPNITAYDGIDSADVDLTEKMCARLGNLNGLTKGGKDLLGYGLWTNNLYLHSETTQTLTEIVAGLSAGITEAGQKAEAVRTDLAAYKTEVEKEFEAADEKFTSAYKATTTAVGNLLLGTNQGAKNWIYNSDSTEKPVISDYIEEGINTAFFEFMNQNDSSAWEMFMYPLRTEKIVAGATYTLSVEVKELNTGMYTPLMFNLANGNGSGALCAFQTSTQTTQPEAWEKFTFTFKATATGAAGGTQHVRLIFPAEATGQMQILQIRNLMLAPGGEAMPWTKAPEDITAENIDVEVAVLEERASTIEQTVNGISQTVTQHTVDLTVQGNRITANESAIKQNADSITQTVTTIEGGMNNLLEGTNLGAEGWTAWCAGGGIVIGEEQIEGYDRYKATVLTNANKDMSGTVFWSWHLRGDLIKKGKPYTLSFDVRQADTDDDEAFRFGARVSLGSGTNADTLLNEVRATQSTVKGAWTHVSVTFAESPQDGTDPINGTENPEYCLYLNYIKKWTALKIKNLKFEEGAMETPWTPAIKDADVQYTEIKQTAEGISMKLHESATAQNYAYGTGTDKIMTSGWNAAGDTNFWLYDVKGFKTGDVVTVSFDIEISGITRGASTDYISMQFNKYYGYKATGFRFTLDKIDDTQTDFLTKLSYTGTLTLGQTTAEGDLAQRDITAEDVATLYLFIRKAEPFGDAPYIKVSRLKVERGDTATAWTPRTGTIDQRLLDTGIDIENRKVTVTADNFAVRNNEGETTAMIDSNGKLSTKIINADELITKRLIAVNEAGQVVSTINIVSQDGRYYTHYPVDANDSSTIYKQAEGYDIGFPVSAMGYDAATDSVLTVNNRKGKARWRLAVGTDGGKYGVVTEFDKWNTIGMAQKSAAIDEDSIQSVIDGLIFPASVEFQEISGGEFTATPVYGTLDMPTMLQVSYKEFDPGQDSAYDTHKGHVKVWDLYESSLEDDFDFTTGVTGVFLRTTRPVQGVVRNNTATDVVSVTFTWTLYIYENGVLTTTRTQAMTYIQ